MSFYLEPIAQSIKSNTPASSLPDAGTEDLFHLYAVLALAKGEKTSLEDVHNAWSAWIVRENPSHESLVPFSDLPDEVKAADRVFANAIRQASRDLRLGSGAVQSFDEVLFPLGGPLLNGSNQDSILNLYKIMVDSSESLVGRRQAVNTFFLTANGALVAAYGIIAKSVDADAITIFGLSFLAGAGVLISFAWRGLIRSFGQLNAGKFKVINAIERHLPAAIYEAEWEALGRGEDPKIYKSFTDRESWIPTILVSVHGFIAIGSLWYAAGTSGGIAKLLSSAVVYLRSLL